MMLPFVLLACLFPGNPLLRLQIAHDLAPISILRAKNAVAFVEIRSGGGGSAFCIAPDGLFVTSYHLLSKARDGKVRLILRPGETNQRALSASVARVDADADLALLRVKGVSSLDTLELGEAQTLVETAPVTAFGYPSALYLNNNQAYSAITVSVGRVTSLHKNRGDLQGIQFDAALKPGNAGGPLLNAQGQVVGIVQSSIAGSGVNVAVPVQKLKMLLQRPEIVFTPPSLTVTAKSHLQTFSISLDFLVQPPPHLSVFLTLQEPGQPPRVYPANSADAHHYTVRAVPVPTAVAPRRVQLVVLGKKTETRLQVEDCVVEVGGQRLRLSAIKEISREATAMVTLRDGRRLVGPLKGLDSVETMLDGLPTTVHLDKIAHLAVTDVQEGPGYLIYHIEVRHGTTLLGEKSGEIAMAGTADWGRRGMLLACYDDWPIRFVPFPPQPSLQNRAEDVTRYIQNVAQLFTHGHKGRFLIYPAQELFDDQFCAVLRQAGHTVLASSDPGPLAAYDGIFVGYADHVDRQALVTYINAGGKVYLSGGAGQWVFWQEVMQPFGMEFLPDNTTSVGEAGLFPVSGDPLFAGVSALLQGGISPIRLLPGKWPHTRALLTYKNLNLWALYVSEPTLLSGTTAPQGTHYVQYPANGHWYAQVTLDSAITWQDAKAQAEKMTYRGWHGHLVTLTSAEESMFVVQSFPDAVKGVYWIGACKDPAKADPRNPALGWTWVTGEAWNYTNWNQSPYQEPNGDFGAPNSNYAQLWGQGGWNDTPNTPPNEVDRPRGFVVEFD
jgi:hypothetical protein